MAPPCSWRLLRVTGFHSGLRGCSCAPEWAEPVGSCWWVAQDTAVPFLAGMNLLWTGTGKSRKGVRPAPPHLGVALGEDGVMEVPAWCKPCLLQSRFSFQELWVLDSGMTTGVWERMGLVHGISVKMRLRHQPREVGENSPNLKGFHPWRWNTAG